jgi:hypothetical protein
MASEPHRFALLPHDFTRTLGRHYDDDAFLATYIRCYLAAYASWPREADIPRSLSGEAELAMVQAGHMIYSGSQRFRIPLVDQVRDRQEIGRARGGAARARNADRQGLRHPTTKRFMSRASKPSIADPAIQASKVPSKASKQPASDPPSQLNTPLRGGDSGLDAGHRRAASEALETLTIGCELKAFRDLLPEPPGYGERKRPLEKWQEATADGSVAIPASFPPIHPIESAADGGAYESSSRLPVRGNGQNEAAGSAATAELSRNPKSTTSNGLSRATDAE